MGKKRRWKTEWRLHQGNGGGDHGAVWLRLQEQEQEEGGVAEVILAGPGPPEAQITIRSKASDKKVKWSGGGSHLPIGSATRATSPSEQKKMYTLKNHVLPHIPGCNEQPSHMRAMSGNIR